MAALRTQLGLDAPIPVRYWNWLTGFATGDMGTSYSYNMPVSEMLSDKLPITALLTVLSFLFTVILSIPLGILAGSVQNKVIDRIVTIIDQIVMRCAALLCGHPVLLPVRHHAAPVYTRQFRLLYGELGKCIGYLIFPALSIALPPYRHDGEKMLRGAILNELDQDYVRTSRSRGVARRKVLSGHVLRNALIPTITFLAVSMAEIMTGTIIIEQVFTIPGIGRLLLASINNRDFPVVQAIVVILAAWIVIVNFVADLLYQLVDPRIRLK